MIGIIKTHRWNPSTTGKTHLTIRADIYKCIEELLYIGASYWVGKCALKPLMSDCTSFEKKPHWIHSLPDRLLYVFAELNIHSSRTVQFLFFFFSDGILLWLFFLLILFPLRRGNTNKQTQVTRNACLPHPSALFKLPNVTSESIFGWIFQLHNAYFEILISKLVAIEMIRKTKAILHKL